MLVKVDTGSAVNVRGVDAVLVKTRQVKVYKEVSGIFFKTKQVASEHDEWDVVIEYRNADNDKARFVLNCGVDRAAALRASNIILDQVKELENTGATQALEEALKNG